MVATKNCDSLTIAYFKCNEKSDCLNAVVAAIDIVAHEQVVSVGRAAAYPKQLHQIMKLAMDVS